jgi:hypothetical protein
MMNSMTELFTKKQQSTKTSLERVECSIAGLIDQVDALETRLPPPDQTKHAEETHEADYHEEEESFNHPHQPPRAVP